MKFTNTDKNNFESNLFNIAAIPIVSSYAGG